MNFDSITDLFLEVENTQIKNTKWEDRNELKLNKVITFVYCSIMDFLENKFKIKTVVTKYIFSNVKYILLAAAQFIILT